MIALPIPDTRSAIVYDELSWHGRNVGEVVETLTSGRVKSTDGAHLDPDVRPELMRRGPGWRPALGQEGTAQAHLISQGVTVGDLFLFWGLFRQVDDHLRPAGKPFHAIWGWLQVGLMAEVLSEVLPALDADRWSWARPHPHTSDERKNPNWLYVAAQRLSLPGGASPHAPGAGVFERFRPELRLTADPDDKLSRWALPVWFDPGPRKALTYHSERDRWIREGDRVLLRTVGRGQEFVLDLAEYPEAIGWIRGLIEGESGPA